MPIAITIAMTAVGTFLAYKAFEALCEWRDESKLDKKRESSIEPHHKDLFKPML